MNDILHQWKWDFRRIRTLWILWVLVLIAAGLGSVQTTGSQGPDSSLSSLAVTAKYVTVYLFGILLVGHLMYTTPFTGTQAFWKTRPLKQSSVFWGKTLMIAVLIFLPVLLVQIAGWQAQNLGGRFLFWASLHYGSLTLAMFFLAAAWAALCKHFGTFWMCFAGTGAFLAICAITFNQLSSRLAFLPFHLAESTERTATSEASTILAMMLVFLLGSAAAWLFGIRLRNRRVAFLAIISGVAVSAGANHIWRTDFLRSLDGRELPGLTLELEVLDRTDAPQDDQQLLWNQVAVTLAPNQIAVPRSWHATFVTTDGVSRQLSDSQNWNSYAHAASVQRRLRSFYPDGTVLFHGQDQQLPCLNSEGVEGTAGRFHGTADLVVYEWRRAASLPLDSAATVRSDEHGTVRIASVQGNRLRLVRVTPPSPFAGQSHSREDDRQWQERKTALVIYHEASGAAVAVGSHGSGHQRSGSFGPELASSKFTLDAPKWQRFTKVKSLEEDRAALRLDLYEAVAVGRARVRWDRDNWTAYSSREVPSPESRELPRPSIARVPLPTNPSPEQIDAYLDGVLFSLSDNMAQRDWQRAEAELKAIGPEHVDRLLARMPVGSYAESIVYRALPFLVTDEQKPAVLEALRRDPGLVVLIHQKGWQEDAAPVLAELLKRRHALDYQSAPLALRIMAAQEDPATYDDLRWHFTHSQNALRETAEVLAQCPGFPFDETLAEMWAHVRYHPGDRRNRLAPLAARLGDKEALRLAFIHYASTGNEKDLALLSRAVAHPGGDSLPAWLHANFAALTFNPESRRFELD